MLVFTWKTTGFVGNVGIFAMLLPGMTPTVRANVSTLAGNEMSPPIAVLNACMMLVTLGDAGGTSMAGQNGVPAVASMVPPVLIWIGNGRPVPI